MKRGRRFLCSLGFGVALLGQPAAASTFRPIPLSVMVEQSMLVVVATPVSHQARVVASGSRQRVVTDFTLEVAWTLRGEDCAGKDIVVRTLGGTVGAVGQIVYGEARLVLGQSNLLFLVIGRDGTYSVLGMAQGQFPLEPTEGDDWQLRSSDGLHGVLDVQRSVARTLAGRRLSEIPAILSSSRESAQ